MCACLPACGHGRGTLVNWANAACVRLSLRGTSASPPARCIHRSLRDTSSAGYRLLVSLASVGASRELSSRRSSAHPSSDRVRGSLRSGDTIPHTCAVSPTFRYGAFFFVASALADLSSSRLTAYGNHASNPTQKSTTTRKQAFYYGSVGSPTVHIYLINKQSNSTATTSKKTTHNLPVPTPCTGPLQ